ncbi:hypothetical protein JKP88DRAFT_351756 [Tribonema minus]|uniref:C2H2-type domain-containing protein n=1 Tax=Tribonema minus TaxID=303371 RepID=A0A835YGC4_9STRA|nr:hypothetical protein JKP88DRAFT_351756 [Tribonema minus]
MDIIALQALPAPHPLQPSSENSAAQGGDTGKVASRVPLRKKLYKRPRKRAYEVDRKYTCPHCFKGYGNASSLNLHVKLKHPEFAAAPAAAAAAGSSGGAADSGSSSAQDCGHLVPLAISVNFNQHVRRPSGPGAVVPHVDSLRRAALTRRASAGNGIRGAFARRDRGLHSGGGGDGGVAPLPLSWGAAGFDAPVSHADASHHQHHHHHHHHHPHHQADVDAMNLDPLDFSSFDSGLYVDGVDATLARIIRSEYLATDSESESEGRGGGSSGRGIGGEANDSEEDLDPVPYDEVVVPLTAMARGSARRAERTHNVISARRGSSGSAMDVDDTDSNLNGSYFNDAHGHSAQQQQQQQQQEQQQQQHPQQLQHLHHHHQPLRPPPLQQYQQHGIPQQQLAQPQFAQHHQHHQQPQQHMYHNQQPQAPQHEMQQHQDNSQQQQQQAHHYDHHWEQQQHQQHQQHQQQHHQQQHQHQQQDHPHQPQQVYDISGSTSVSIPCDRPTRSSYTSSGSSCSTSGDTCLQGAGYGEQSYGSGTVTFTVPVHSGAFTNGSSSSGGGLYGSSDAAATICRSSSGGDSYVSDGGVDNAFHASTAAAATAACSSTPPPPPPLLRCGSTGSAAFMSQLQRLNAPSGGAAAAAAAPQDGAVTQLPCWTGGSGAAPLDCCAVMVAATAAEGLPERLPWD